MVGQSGAGKSTLISLLLRLYDPSSGDIKIDNVSLAYVPLPVVRQKIFAVVGQEAVLFTGTVLDNVLYGLDESRLQAMGEGEKMSVAVGALLVANAMEFVEKLPNGIRCEVRGTFMKR